MFEIGSLVYDKYTILNKIEQSCMSAVYLAVNEKTNKRLVIKEVRKGGIRNFEIVKQGLVADVDALKKLNHPNLPQIIDVIETEESIILLMDYVEGVLLSDVLDEYGAQPQENVIKWAKQLCGVLDYLHTRTPAIIHHDLKPANTILKADGTIVLIDFGIACEVERKNLTDIASHDADGYMAPEQREGREDVDARTDMYGFGVMLHHLLTGAKPSKPLLDMDPTLPADLGNIILKCVQQNPNDRYQSAAELMRELERCEWSDVCYRKKQIGKLWAFGISVVLTVLFAAASVWGYVSAEQKHAEDSPSTSTDANENANDSGNVTDGSLKET